MIVSCDVVHEPDGSLARPIHYRVTRIVTAGVWVRDAASEGALA
jgi:hypothetical protein